MSESILNNHFIGKGALQKSDQPFDLTLARKKDRAALVTYEGKVIAFDVEKLSYAADERIQLSALRIMSLGLSSCQQIHRCFA